ncbi:L-ectoine synthase [Halobacillus litoralis]|uniref:L-ectoine synthase n=1 Tax=Halobacillus litoralis TaxID=45668 RepID=A0A845DPZ7_9BACI|nr:ectoine synthase [Halobacillus litoralis]MCA1022773.1 ectoine synthase [Halobacillus litoralis]MYL19523.1 L-ectoine synthase [Halobacillus litoralis]MYL37900.1 L-ectoine synthase [Halobacillus litoralis]
MKVRALEDILGSSREVKGENWTSRRLIVAEDHMGCSVHDTLIRGGTETKMWYKHHLESVYCIEGEGEVITLSDQSVWPIRENTLYALDQHDEHVLRAFTDMRMICVFNPPLHGDEKHDADGTYPMRP